jgi:hypothetical protein
VLGTQGSKWSTMIDGSDSVDYILSLVRPAAAFEVAERLRHPLRNIASPPIFVDCNAVAPTTMHGIAHLLDPLPSSTRALSEDRRIRPPDRASTPPGSMLIGS